MNGFILRAPSTIHFGEHVAEKVGEEAKRFGAKRALIVTDPFLSSSRAIDPVSESIKKAGLELFIYSGVDQEPTMEHVDECLKTQRLGNCDLLVAVGGGSPIDV
ncbi:MAG: iron-containing alcohol dehydrogenase, partial [Deltaproteobacteria bacterium]|nr:iron-containing alcohol dehydrogenase [Deltaproteobacteria bacterium]